MGNIVRYITQDGSAFVIAANTTEMVREMEKFTSRQQLLLPLLADL